MKGLEEMNGDLPPFINDYQICLFITTAHHISRSWSLINDHCLYNNSYINLVVRIFIFLAFFLYFPCIYLSTNIIAIGGIIKEAWPSPNLYDSWRSSDMFFQRRLLNKQSIPPGHRRKSNMIIKSGHIEQQVFLKNKERTFCWKQRQKSQKIYIEEAIFG